MKNMFVHVKKLDQYLPYLPILWLILIPLGNTPRAIGLVAAITFIIFQKNSISKIFSFLKEPWFLTLSLAILWSYLSLLWTPKPNTQLQFYISKISFLWLLPFFILGFQMPKQKQLSYPLFLISMLIPFSLSLIKYFFHWKIHGDASDPGFIFYNHIITGFFASFAAFLALELYIKEKKYIYLIAFFLFSFQVLFLNTGKAAYGIYLLLISYSMWEISSWKTKLSAIIFGAIIAIILIKTSASLKLALFGLKSDIHEFQSGNLNTSFGFRVQFHQFAYLLFKKHWLVGNGIGAYDYWFKVLNTVPAWSFQPNTHSQYWFFACDLGLIGLLLWLSTFIILFKQAKQFGWHGHIFNGFLLAFGLNCFTDNMLFASPENLLFILLAIAYPQKT